MRKGYLVDSGYMGYVPDSHEFLLFASESDYDEFMMDI